MPLCDFELQSRLEMEVVLKVTLQKDSPVCAIWVLVLYLGTENTFELSVLCSAGGGGVGRGGRGVSGEDRSCAFFP